MTSEEQQSQRHNERSRNGEVQVWVTLTGRARMRQRHRLSVPQDASEKDIQAIALGSYNDHTWDYEGMDDESIEVTIDEREARSESEDKGEDERAIWQAFLRFLGERYRPEEQMNFGSIMEAYEIFKARYLRQEEGLREIARISQEEGLYD